mgnify:FL=1|jgi:hypothetical protein|tara:strand:+ start:1628 stop:1846 length:219 start_codon:yes stop_codon:yes gene_type:complete
MDYHTVKYIQNKVLKPKIDTLTEKIKLGVDTFEEYKYIIGQIRSCEDLHRDLTDLLKKQEPNEDTDQRGTKA